MSPQVAFRRLVFALLSLLLALGVGLFALPATPVSAATFIVNVTADSGGGSLRDAITQVNVGAGTGDTINITATGTIMLGSALPALAKNVTISGPTSGPGVTVDGNHAVQVLVVNSGVTASISNLTIANGNAGSGGGMDNLGGLTLTNVTLSGNSAGNGGGIYNDSSGALTLVNDTFSGNTTSGNGGGIYNHGGTVTGTNCTLTANSAPTGSGGGIFMAFVIQGLNLTNTIVAGNTGLGGASDIDGTLTANDHNITNGDPLLAPLGNYGGPTQTVAPLPGSRAINAGTASGAPATDQRGMSRVGTVDIGAFESQGFTLVKTSGDGQSTGITTYFAPLVVTVASSHNEPVNGGIVTFTGPGSGADITVDPQTVTIGATTSRQASITPRANVIAGGPYTITVATTGTTPPSVAFSLTNAPGPKPTFTVGTTADHAAGSPAPLSACMTANNTTCALRDAIGYATSGVDTIVFNATGSGTITLTNGSLTLTASVTITGPTSGTAVAVSGNHAVRVFTIQSPIIVSISNMTIMNGSANVGGGIYNVSGTLILTNTVITGNAAIIASDAGGIANYVGNLTVIDSTISNNTACNGGGISNQNATMTIMSSTISDNTATCQGSGNGGGIFTINPIAVLDSTFVGNKAAGSDGVGGAIFSESFAPWPVTNCTIVGNTAATAGGGIFFQNNLTITNDIIAGNANTRAGTAPDDVSSFFPLISNGYNLIGFAGNQAGYVGTDLLNVNPLAAPLGNYGGPTQTIALLPGSPAIDAGTATGAPATDQRGMSRVGTVDIGAFESQGFILARTSGDGQHVPINTAFAPLVVTVTANVTLEPVDGGIVTFTGPTSGAGIVTTPIAVTIAGGQASITPTANGTAGSNYTVTAVATGTTPPSVAFTLTNDPVATLVSITVTAPANLGSPPTVKVGQTTLPFTATGIYADGSTHDLSAQVQWSPSNTKATVDASGRVTGAAPGSVQIIATLNGMSGRLPITVGAPTPVGITVPPAPPGRPAPQPSGGPTGGPPPAPLPTNR
ncbi:MAG: choice-of-anchor Q domain-containing protein [Thermomicrobiales bacterium]